MQLRPNLHVFSKLHTNFHWKLNKFYQKPNKFAQKLKKIAKKTSTKMLKNSSVFEHFHFRENRPQKKPEIVPPVNAIPSLAVMPKCSL